MPVEIIAEGEINHNGDVKLAKKLVDAAKQCGADTIKFQCFVANGFIAPGSSFLPIFEDNELSLEDFRAIRDHAEQAGIKMISTAADIEGLAMIVELDLPVIKVGSTNITNVSLLRGIAETGKPVYLSTGASTIDEIETAMNLLKQGGGGDVTLYHCTVQYPAPDEALNLQAMQTMMQVFPGVPVGFSDHSKGSLAAAAAVAMGAVAVEKHFTLDHHLPGPDHGFSSDPEEFGEYVKTVRAVEKMLGSPEKVPTEAELIVRLNGRRYMTAFADMAKGDIITQAMIRPRRIDPKRSDPATLLGPDWEEQMIGAKAARDIVSGTALTRDDVEFP